MGYQNNTFVGNLASAPEITGVGDKLVCKFTLISNEYIGKDPNTNERKTRDTLIRFVGFGKIASRLEKMLMVGDQIIVDYKISNNNYERDGQTVYGFNFTVNNFDIGAPGKARREKGQEF